MSLLKLSVPLPGTSGVTSEGLLMPKLKYRFRVTLTNFGGESSSTVITKQVQDVTRPQVTFESITLDAYNSRVYVAGKHSWAAVSLNVRDDITGDVNKLFGKQLTKQFDFAEQASARSAIDYKFTTKIEMLDGGNGSQAPAVLETWEMYGCYLESVNYNNLAYSENAPVLITATIKYDNALQIGTTAGVGIANTRSTTSTMASGTALTS